MTKGELIDQWCTGCGEQMHEGEPLHKRTAPGHSEYKAPVVPDAHRRRSPCCAEEAARFLAAWAPSLDEREARFRKVLEDNMERSYRNGHVDGYECGAECATECEHVGDCWTTRNSRDFLTLEY